MAYITKEEVKRIRDEIKKEFTAKDGWKISVVRKHYSTVNIHIFESKINFTIENLKYYSINPYIIEKEFANNPEMIKVFKKIEEIITGVKIQVNRNAGDPTADYCDCNFYYNIFVGTWDKEFVQVK